MCELLAVCSAQATTLDLEWAEFSSHGSQDSGNPDGWGVGYYRGLDVALFREPQPGADSACANLLDRCAPPSPIAIAHVRRAVRGAAVLANCQPFARLLAGRVHLFAHNGNVADFHEMDAKIPAWLSCLGDTDSERLFALLLTSLAPVWSRPAEPTVEARLEVVSEFATRMRERGAVNFLYSDGELVFAHGHRRTLPGDEISTDPGLYLLERGVDCPEPLDAPLAGLRQSGRCTRQALVATVPLNDQGWTPLAPGQVVCLRNGARIA